MSDRPFEAERRHAQPLLVDLEVSIRSEEIAGHELDRPPLFVIDPRERNTRRRAIPT